MNTNRRLELTRPLLVFDLETTGLDVDQDRIIEIACIRMHPSGDEQRLHHRLNPDRHISAEASAVHGIYDADIAHCPKFTDVAHELQQFFAGADLSGFNIERFDLPLLQREFQRVNIAFPASDTRIVDTWRIYMQQEPRDLSAAYRFYCGGSITSAHSAAADTEASRDILVAQIQRYAELPQTVDALHTVCHPKNSDWLDDTGKIRWSGDEAVLTFGKHRNRPLSLLAREEPDYLRWIVGSNFTPEVVSIVKNALSGAFPKRQNGAA